MRPVGLAVSFAIGFAAATLCWSQAGRGMLPVAAGSGLNGAGGDSDLASLKNEIEIVKGKLPDQAHAMMDVNYHFANLWFAGQKEHWELAKFYWSETRSHLRWGVRIIPKRKDNAGQEIDLEKILQAVENSPLKELENAINAKDKSAFNQAYRFTLEGCYSCHKAADKPYLRPQLPTQPETHIINFDPNADWPK